MANGAVVVHFGEAYIFEWQVAQGVQRGRNSGLSALYLLKKLLNLLNIHKLRRRTREPHPLK